MVGGLVRVTHTYRAEKLKAGLCGPGTEQQKPATLTQLPTHVRQCSPGKHEWLAQ